jgi:dolichyl-phosphate-mannose--protein O-mannosyl transferase
VDTLARVAHRAESPLLQRLNRPWVAILAVAAIAAVVRLWGLSSPPTLVFDENYYAKAACIFVGGTDRYCKIESPNERAFRAQEWDVGSFVHPPLGKWTIALGIKAFGMDPFGWRIGSAVAGTLAVTGVALIAHLLFGRPLWTFLAGLLLALEHLSVVLSRQALLDVHVQLWIVAGFLCLVIDRRWIDVRTPRGPPAERDGSTPKVPSPLWRPWRYAAGIAFGAAVAVKWSGGLGMLTAIVVSLVWETSRRRERDTSIGSERRKAFVGALAQESFALVIAFVLIPTVVYVASYLPWLHHFDWKVGELLDQQLRVARYHLFELKTLAPDADTGALTPTHYGYSRPWTWLVMTRPVPLTWQDLGPNIRQLTAIGNPVVFWGSVWALPYLGWAWWRKREWVPGCILLAVLLQYLPWLLVARPQFFFYVAPFTPFLVLGLVYLLRDLSDARLIVREPGGAVATDPEGRPAVSVWHPYRPIAWTVVAAAVGLFMWFWPVLSWGVISDTRYQLILWFPGWR